MSTKEQVSITHRASRFMYQPGTAENANRFEITSIPLVKRLLSSRWFQWSLTALTLPLFVLAILAGLFGTPAGSRNFGIVFVWIVWWALLMLILVPFAGRLWCTMCPIPAPGEWLQRRAFIGPRGGKLTTLGRRWPRPLNNIWLQNALFLAVVLFSKVILTTPLVSSVMLLLFVALAILTSLLFERRVFCRYICPVGGFIGIYSQLAPVEVRIKDRALCSTHQTKTCYVGSASGYGCPWLVYPAALQRNTYCGLCTECFKTCPRDNMGVFVRPFGQDLASNQGRRLDEAYRALMMLACALVYTIVFMGPWAQVKEAAYAVGSPAWWVYALALTLLTIGVVPGLFYLCAAIARRISASALPARKLFVDYAYTLLPLGLAAWAAFNLSFVLINFTYAWPVLSDPFGWGWNLFGTANWPWVPYLAGWQAAIQVPILLVGLVGAIAVAFRTARSHRAPPRAALPVVGFCLVFTLVMMGLFV